MRDFECPSYDGDGQQRGFPSGAELLRDRLEACDAFVVASPEYNGTASVLDRPCREEGEARVERLGPQRGREHEEGARPVAAVRARRRRLAHGSILPDLL